MARHRIRKGLDVPISGAPEQSIHDGPPIYRVAVMGDDTPDVRAKMAVAEGDTVERGQLLFEDRKRPGIRYTAPGAGTVQAIFRGHRRVLRSVVIALSETERSGTPRAGELVDFESWSDRPADTWSGAEIRTLMLESGLWTALRARPFSKVPLPDEKPHALFVTAIDTHPLAADPDVVVLESLNDFQRGLRAVAKLCEGESYLCIRDGSEIRAGADADVKVESWQGPHPAGNPGLHIHTLAPVSRHRSAWHIGYQDVIALGRLLQSGRLPVERVVALGGPVMTKPRLVRTRLGASFDELLRGEIAEAEPGGPDVRVISGSALSGKRAMGPELGFLGRYHTQITALLEGTERHLLGWAAPGGDQFSILPVFVSKLFGPSRRFDMTTDTHGSQRAMMPIGTYEQVMPMDILATYLLRSIVVGDLEQAEALGALELDEEDIALCTFVCTGKNEFGPHLRASLERIEKEG